MCKRNENESFEDYKVRRKAEKQQELFNSIGRIIVPGKGYNRTSIRNSENQKLGHGKQNRFSKSKKS
jgi:hypothetical protein